MIAPRVGAVPAVPEPAVAAIEQAVAPVPQEAHPQMSAVLAVAVAVAEDPPAVVTATELAPQVIEVTNPFVYETAEIRFTPMRFAAPVPVLLFLMAEQVKVVAPV